MEIGIIGLPKSGKTTIFNALTQGQAETSAYASSVDKVNIGVIKVPDPRLDGLQGVFKPKKRVPAEVQYVDIPLAPKGLGRSEGIGGEFLHHLQSADALLHVVRDFIDEAVPHIEGSVDPQRDTATMNMELAFADLAILERRLQRLKNSLKGAKSHEREALLKEQALMERIKEALEGDIPLREQSFSDDEAKAIENYQFLTAKPLLLVLNIGEERLGETVSLEAKLESCQNQPQTAGMILCGKLEMELAQLDEADAQEFRSSMELDEAGLKRMIRLSYELLGLVSFFTVVSEEVKAWTVRKGSNALSAAGKIHSDMERGFIRAEVVSYDDLIKCGSLAEARKQGLLRLEGKGYTVQDGDIITFLFNV